MNLNTNGAKAIAVLLVLNAGLFVSHHHVSIDGVRGPLAVNSELAATRAQVCKARTEARTAAMEARIQSRMAAREMEMARKQMQADAARAAHMAPTSAPAATHTMVKDYVRCLVTSGMRSMSSGI